LGFGAPCPNNKQTPCRLFQHCSAAIFQIFYEVSQSGKVIRERYNILFRIAHRLCEIFRYQLCIGGREIGPGQLLAVVLDANDYRICLAVGRACALGEERCPFDQEREQFFAAAP